MGVGCVIQPFIRGFTVDSARQPLACPSHSPTLSGIAHTGGDTRNGHHQCLLNGGIVLFSDPAQ